MIHLHDSTASLPSTHRLSIVVPVYNEEECAELLVERIHQALAEYPCPFEVILVDDGSSDQTHEHLQTAARTWGPHVRIVEFQRNFGQTAAMQAGIDAARGDVIATMDGDLQNDPADIPRMVRRLFEEDLDVVAGWRKNRQDAVVLRKTPSRIANWLIGRVTGVRLHDYGCTLKVFRAPLLKNLRLYGDMHRFIPAWLAMQTTPRRIQEEVVAHHARTRGRSKYGIGRTFRVVLDLLAVHFFMRYNTRPGHFFGALGLASGSAGSAILAYLFGLKLLGDPIGGRPLLLVGVLLVLMSLQLLSTGLLSELLMRVYQASGQGRSYVVRNAEELVDLNDAHWHGGAGAPKPEIRGTERFRKVA